MTEPITTRAHAIWTVLPDGYADRERTRLRLALVVSPRAITANGRLDGLLELLDWPAQLATVRTVGLFVDGQAGVTQATVTSRPPESGLWRALFPPSTPVRLDGGGEVTDAEQAGSSVLYRPLVETLRGVYRSATTGAGDDGALGRALTGLAQWSLAAAPAAAGPGGARGPAGAAYARAVVPAAAPAVRDEVARLLDPTTATAASLARAAAVLREHGLPEAAAVAPLVGVIRRLRGPGSPVAGRGGADGSGGSVVDPDSPPTTPVPPPGDGAGPPGLLDHVRTADEADFHQVLGLVSAHPALALVLGLQLTLEIPAFEGTRTIRVTGGLPLLVPGGAPWSKVTAHRQSGRFVMATQDGVASEIRNGMLDVRPAGPGSEKYVLTTMDVVGTTAQLAGMATAVRAGDPPPGGLPPRRNVGITLAQVDRRGGTVAHAVTRGKHIAASFGEPPDVSVARAPRLAPDPAAVPVVQPGEVVLHADDVTTGYRIDVRRDGGEWRSLVRRVATYTVAGDRSSAFTVHDEGFVDAVPLVEQRAADGTDSHVEVGEVIATWDGWSAAVRRPGPTVSTDDGPATTELVPRRVSARNPLHVDVEVEPGSLPKLRFGGTYEFRARAVDLAGNSVAPDAADPQFVSPPIRYRRLDALPAPELVLRAPLRAGEAVTRMVVRSDGDGAPLGGDERHVAPPKAWQHLAETHGLFDAAIGPGADAATRDRLLALGSNEAGAFTDPLVPDPADPTRRIPAPGIRVAVNADAAGPPTGSLDGLVRGTPLPPGEYVVHDTSTPFLPYLADPLAHGVALAGLPTPDGAVVTARYGGRGWPDVQPMRIVARPGQGAGLSAQGSTADGRPVVTLTVPPAADLVFGLSGTLTPQGLALCEADLAPGAVKGALDGQEPLLTPAREVRVVHAVRRPLLPLAMQTATAAPDRVRGSTVANVSGTALVHPASTAKIDVEAVWAEVVDDGVHPVRTEQRVAVVGSRQVEPDTATVAWSVRHSFGDTLRRDVTYRPVGTTRFREHFPPGTPTEQLVRRVDAGVATTVVNAAVPQPPEIHSVLPTFTWERTVENGQYVSVRRTAGVRVWLRRPWMQSGTGERLGVVVYRDQASGEAAKKSSHPLHSEVTRWNGDPVDGWGHVAPHLTAANLPAGIEVTQLPQLALPGQPGGARVDVVGHAVHHDAGRDLWYADVDLDLDDPQAYFPFVRLAVVRHQPRSAPGCHVSQTVVTDPVQLPPTRELVAVATSPSDVSVQVTGPYLRNSLFEVNLNTRAPDPALGFTGDPNELSVRASSPGGHHHPMQTQVIGESVVAATALNIRINGVPNGTPVARLIVREVQWGDSLHDLGEGFPTDPDGAGNRPVYVEVIDHARLREIQA